MDLYQKLQKMINLYYDKYPIANGYSESGSGVHKEITITDHFKWIGMEYNILNPDTYQRGKNLYVIELFDVSSLEDIFKNISIESMELLRSEQLTLLVYFPIEGFGLELHNNWFSKLHHLFESYQLTKTKKYFIFNNYTIEEQYESIKHTLPCNFTKVFGFPFFHVKHNQLMRSKNEIKDKEVFVNDTKDKNFVCFNTKMRAHRLLLVSELGRRNILSDSYTSLVGKNYGWESTDTTLAYASAILLNIFEKDPIFTDDMKTYFSTYTSNWKPMFLDYDATSPLDEEKVTVEYYKNSFFSIVTETGLGHPVRITEKTFKPIANYHPYIVVGSQYTLKYLRSIGYETFPELFDESYDEEPNEVLRLIMIIDEVEKFCKKSIEEKRQLFNKVLPKLDHNYNMFHNVNSVKLKDDFKKIFLEVSS